MLEQFCEHLQPADIQPFLEPFMQRLMHLVKTGSPVVKEMSLSAIATTAVAAEKRKLTCAGSLRAWSVGEDDKMRGFHD